MPATTPLARWLREEMPRHGYPLEGPRAGGITRLADAAGVSRPSLSRIVSGQAEQPSIDALRKIGHVLGYSLGDMMIHAGLATPEDVATQVTVGPVRAATNIPRPTIEIPEGVDPSSIPRWEWELWNVNLPLQDRRNLIHFQRLMRGDLKDEPETLRELHEAIGTAISDYLRQQQDPPRAV